MGEKVFVSWSGGKDSYLAMLKAVEAGLDVVCLLNFLGTHGNSMSHGVSGGVLNSQAKALGLRLESERVTWDSYEEGFVRAVERLKEEGVTGGVFGDINLPGHREWVEKICGRLGITAHLPLWGMEEEQVVTELLARGSRLQIVALDKAGLSREWLGKEINQEFIEACKIAGVTPCGEKGEYHTLVVGGPLFKNPLMLSESGWRQEENKYFLELHQA